jgi:crotonobetainyl-CoA:carnitine CoA-transferase CaiB-like acyl-CoA transferase
MHNLLKGIRVVDLTTIVLGPYATQLLGDMGATVIKIEQLSGDLFRSARPGRSARMGAGFLNCNRNKRSIALDLTREEGREAFRCILKTADVLVHNMRPQSAAKLGVSYENAKAVKPNIVYCYATGFGQNGPYAAEPAYDDTIQAASGLAFLNANAAGEPRFLPTIIGDKVAGLHLALAVLGGIVARQKTREGCCIEAPMYESIVSFLMVEQLAGLSFRPPLGGVGYERLLSPNRKPYPTSDGYISILPYNTAHWTRFLELIGREDLAELDLVRDPVKRSESIDQLYTVIANATPARTTGEWLAALKERDIPCARVNRLADLLNDEHLQAVGLFTEVEHPTEGAMTSVRSPFRVVNQPARPDWPAPVLGSDTYEILCEAGFEEDDIKRMLETGVAYSATEVD